MIKRMKSFNIYKKNFKKEALRNGFSQNIIEKCLVYSENLSEKNLPIIYNTYHLSALVGYKHNYLTRSIISTYFFYRHFNIKKKNGTQRTIAEPLPSLKEIQYFILNEILYKIPCSKYCKSYIPKKKFKEYLKYHTNEKVVLTLDITDFFPSIKYNLIYSFFIKLGYAKDVSFYLAHLCKYKGKEEKEEKKRFLPQGAPTSPYLSNLILKEFDDEVADYCKKNNVKYTRYADDMAFSGDNINKEDFENFIQKKLDILGLQLNKNKSLLMYQNIPQVISGVLVNEKTQLPKNERNKIRQSVYFIRKFSLEDHIKKINENRDNYLFHLIGRVNYALSLNPNDSEMIEYKDFLNSIKSKKR